MGYAKPRQILNDHLEEELTQYILICSKIYYGLTPKNIREIAYELALANQVKVPDTWYNSKMASAEWFSKFLKRHRNLSLREPEATSLSRATSFNKHNVSSFFENLKAVFDRYKFQSKDVWNADETGVQTVQRPSKIVAEKGARQVGKATSAERGQTVTIATAVSAIGNFVPPLFIFPRVFYKDHFIHGGPPGCIGTAHPSGWMTGPSFVIFVQHFHRHVKSSPEHPCLLLLDNHDSHLSIEVLNFCKNNGVILLSFPPHTSHRLQPLDKSVYGPFKKFYFSAADNWLTSNPGKTITLYDIPCLVKSAFANSMTPNNIIAGFKSTGIMPFNPHIFRDEDFLSSYVTDRPVGPSASAEIEPTVVNLTGESSTASSPTVKPEHIRPLPKAGERKRSGKGRQPLKSSILTDSPVKERIEKETTERELKKLIKQEKAKMKLFKSLSCKQNEDSCKKQNVKETKKRASSKRGSQEVESDSEGDEETFCLVCLETYSTSKPGQDWIQCISCKNWAHISCGEDSPTYTCINCQSDVCLSSDSD